MGPTPALLSRVIVGFLAFSSFVQAKKERANSPTLSPTSGPTHSPTYFPTLSPTLSPSNEPTVSTAPVLSTPEPTSSASTASTVEQLPRPAEAEPLNVTLSPTISPTTSPTRMQTASPTSTTTDTFIHEVELPNLAIDVVVSEDEGSSFSRDELEMYMATFVEEILESESGVGTFDYAVFDFAVIVSSFGRRRLDSGLSIRMDGTAFYGNNPPTTEFLSSAFRAYFSVWGIGDLEQYLQYVGFPSATVIAITVDGGIVKRVEGFGELKGATVVNSSSSATSPKTKQQVSPAVIAGLVASCAVILMALAFGILLKRSKGKHWSRRQNRRRNRRARNRNHDVDEDSPTPPASQNFSPNLVDDQSVGAMSMDLSIYTTDYTVVTAPSAQYDTRRLDAIIEMGRKHSSTDQSTSSEE